MRSRLLRHRPKLVQALRMTVASLATYGLGEAFGLPQAYWAVITAIIVTQSSLGSSLKAAFDRFLGSVLGAAYGGLVTFVVPHHGGWTSALALSLAVAPLAVAAAASAGFRIAPITAVIVLLGTTGATLGPLAFALDRLLEVGLGCAVGLLVSLVVAPARATRALVAQAGRTAELLADQLAALATLEAEESVEALALPLATRRSLARLEALVAEADRERRSRLAVLADPDPLLRTLLRLRHDIVMLRRTVREAGTDVMRAHVAAPWAAAASAGAERLRAIAAALAGGRAAAPESRDLTEAVSAYRGAIDEMHRSHRTDALTTDGIGRIFWIAFSLDQLRRNLDDLAERAGDMARDEADRAG
ncbi:FUSC family protein [Methylobacterium oryzihabitans]|nr:FUSC family protein [Methylobacterium oryzihabitans]